MHQTRIILGVSLILILSGCDLFTSADHTGKSDRELPRELSAQEQLVAEASNNFSFELLKMLHEKEGDQPFFVSPLSISTAFAMALNGAGGDTYEQMRDFFGYDGMTNEEINQAYFDLIELLTTLDPKVVMNIANSVWVREDFQVLEEFLERNRTFFDAKVTRLDFSKPEAPDIINAWINEKTKGLIEEMIDQIDPLVVMYLINAIYFNGDWTVQFDPEETKERRFYLDDGTTTEIPMMTGRHAFRHYFGDDWTALDMWYGDAGFSFTALMPAEGTLEESVSNLTQSRFNSITGSLQQDTINVFVPKFELDYEIDDFPFDLTDMGLTLPFDPWEADFSRITDLQQIYISDVMHRAVIKLDEEGSEAAAVTVIEFRELSNIGGGKIYPTIRLDRPFLFFIRENSTNTILFMGAFTGFE
jgi:serine protease inhibitor